MKYYVKPTPIDKDGTPVQMEPAPYTALAVTGNTNVTASSVLSFTPDTTAIEIAVLGAGGAVMKWITTASTSPSVFGVSSVGATNPPNFDHAIPAATYRRFAIPIETGGIYAPSSQVGANVLNGLYKRLAVVSQGGTSSVIVTEY